MSLSNPNTVLGFCNCRRASCSLILIGWRQCDLLLEKLHSLDGHRLPLMVRWASQAAVNCGMCVMYACGSSVLNGSID